MDFLRKSEQGGNHTNMVWIALALGVSAALAGGVRLLGSSRNISQEGGFVSLDDAMVINMNEWVQERDAAQADRVAAELELESE